MKKDWIKWVSRLFILLLLLALLDVIIGSAFDALREEGLKRNPQAISLKSEYTVKKMDADVVIVGSSLASRHYVPSILSDSLECSVFNAGQDGFFFYCQNTLIHLILERYSPKMIIWEIGETSLSNLSDATEFQAMNRLYPYYHDEYCRNMIDRMGKYQKYKMKSKLYRNNSNISVLLRNINVIEQNDNGYVGLPSEGYQYPSKFHAEPSTSVDSVRIATFINTLNSCRLKGVKIIIASSPRYCDGAELNGPSFGLLKELCERNNVPFLDYYFTFSSDSTMFKDASHMNRKGSEAYSKMIVNELKKSLNQ